MTELRLMGTVEDDELRQTISPIQRLTQVFRRGEN